MLQSTKTLPAGYRQDGKLDLGERKGLALALNVVASFSVIIYGALFLFLAVTLRPSAIPTELSLAFGDVTWWLLLVRLLVLTALMLLLHEGVHGIAFRIFNGEWGTFAFKGLYAYAAAAEWYMPRNRHIVTALAPFVGLSVLGVLLMPIFPASLLPDLVLFLIFNASGALGDVLVVIWLLTKPREAYVNDYGDGVAVYVPQTEGPQTEGPETEGPETKGPTGD